jgi:SAM-dependent methyltransferase
VDFYDEGGSLFVEAYDAFYSSADPQLERVVAFYERLAREVGGPVLELACGTGRIAIPLAKARLHVTGVDLSEAMLAIARRKLAGLPAIRRHLEPTGRLALHLFDPRLDFLIDTNAPSPGLSGTHPETGRRYLGEVLQTNFDHVDQVRRDLWRYTEIGSDGEVRAQDTREMALRWTYRWELHHLLNLCSFTVEAEYSDFSESEPVYGNELIVIARPG